MLTRAQLTAFAPLEIAALVGVSQAEQIFLHRDCMTLDPSRLGHVSQVSDPPYSKHVHAKAVSCAQEGAAKGVRQRDLGFEHLSPELLAYVVEASACAARWGVIYCDIEGPKVWEPAINARIVRDSKAGEGGYIRTVPLDPDDDDVEEIAETDGGVVGQYKWIRWSSPQQSGDRPPSGAEWVVLSHVAGHMRWGGPGNLTSLRHTCLRGDDKHTTEKPLDQALDLIAWHTDPGDLVYDPTGGRATLGVACALLGRSYVGCELQESEAALGAARIADARNGVLSARDLERFARWGESLNDHLARLNATRVSGGDANQTRSAQWLRSLHDFVAKCPDVDRKDPRRPQAPVLEWLRLANRAHFVKGLPL